MTMPAAPVVQFAGQSLHAVDDESLLQLLLRPDLPDFLTTMYNDEVDRRMGTLTPEAVTP